MSTDLAPRPQCPKCGSGNLIVTCDQGTEPVPGGGKIRARFNDIATMTISCHNCPFTMTTTGSTQVINGYVARVQAAYERAG